MNLQDLLVSAYKISTRLDESANEEQRLFIDIKLKLDQLSLEISRTEKELKSLKKRLQGS